MRLLSRVASTGPEWSLTGPAVKILRAFGRMPGIPRRGFKLLLVISLHRLKYKNFGTALRAVPQPSDRKLGPGFYAQLRNRAEFSSGLLFRKIFAIMSAAAFAALQGGTHNQFGQQQDVSQLHQIAGNGIAPVIFFDHITAH